MTSVNGLETFPTYAEQAEDLYPSIEQLSQNTAENYSRGFQPLETLPAKWYNSMIHALTKQAEETKLVVDSIYAELKNIIEAAGLSLTGTDPKQLLKAVRQLVADNTPIATATKPGVVLSSAADWKVAVDADGVMSVNTTAASTAAPGLVQLTSSGWGLSAATGTVRTVAASTTVAGIVKLDSSTNSTSETTAATPKAVKAAYDLANGKYTAADATTTTAGLVKLTSSGWGLSNANGAVRTVAASTTTAGIVQLNSATSSTSETTAATPKAVKAAYDLANGKYTAADATTTTAGLVKLTTSGWGLSAATGTVRTVAASTTVAGIVQLNSATNSTSETTAATSKAVKAAYDAAGSAYNLATSARSVANGKYTAADATTTTAGLVKLTTSGWGLSNADGTVRTVAASTTVAGIVKLDSSTNSTSETTAATPKAVKAAYDLANGKYTAADATTTTAGLVKLTTSGWGLSAATGTVRTVAASTTTAGIVTLSSSTSSTSETTAATSKAVKAAYDKAAYPYTLYNNSPIATIALASDEEVSNSADPLYNIYCLAMHANPAISANLESVVVSQFYPANPSVSRHCMMSALNYSSQRATVNSQVFNYALNARYISRYVRTANDFIYLSSDTIAVIHSRGRSDTFTIKVRPTTGAVMAIHLPLTSLGASKNITATELQLTVEPTSSAWYSGTVTFTDSMLYECYILFPVLS